MKRNYIGWQGISFPLPPDWNLGSLEGDHRKGYLRIDDAADVRVELRWEDCPRPVATERIAERHLADLAKRAKRKAINLKVTRHIKMKKVKKGELFLWEGDVKCYNLIRRCEQYSRIISMRIMGKLNEDIKPIAEEIYANLEDHPTGGMSTWAVYGFFCRIPESFSLANYSLKAGHIVLSFTQGRQMLKVERRSLASILLRDISLREWFKNSLAKELKPFVWEMAEEEYRDHTGLIVDGKEYRRWRRRIFSHLQGRIWHCPLSNQIFYVESIDGGEELLGNVCREVRCH